MSKKKTKSKETSTTTGSSYTRPDAPAYLQDQVQSQSDLINTLRGRSGSDFVAGPSALQQAGFDMLSQRNGLGGSTGGTIKYMPDGMGGMRPSVGTGLATNGSQSGPSGFDTGLDMARQAGLSGASYAASPGGYTASQFGGATVAPTTQAEAAQIGNMATFGGANFDPSNIDGVEAAQIGRFDQVGARQGAAFMDAYQNPYEQDVIDATLADFDNQAGRTRAAQQAQSAATGAFGGSRNAIREAMIEDDLSRARATTAGNLRRDGFVTAAQLGMSDADRELSANATNAGISADMARAQAQLEQQASLTNFGAAQDNARFGAQLDQQTGLENMDALNQGILTQAGFNQNANLTNAGFENDRARTNASLAQQAGLANMGAENDASRFNLGQEQDINMFNANQRETALNRALQSAGLQAGIQGDMDANARAEIAQLLQAGGVQRDINQQGAGADLALAQLLAELTGALPAQWVTGQQAGGTSTTNSQGTTTQSGGLFGDLQQAAGIGSTALSFFSDIRLKDNIEPDGELFGFPAYRYNYRWEPETRRRGVMAHEVAKTRPDAIEHHSSGYLKVNYGKLAEAA